MNTSAILVATDVTDDASLITKLLREEFEHVTVASEPDRAVEDFEKRRPAVLVLAFDALEKAQSYCLGLYRRSTQAHGSPHRTVVLCSTEEVKRAYDLCRKGHFDDYVLFWPMNYDAQRLKMAVHHALRDLAHGNAPSASEFAAQARNIATLDSVLEQRLFDGGERMGQASRSVGQAERGIAAALDNLSRRLASGSVEMSDPADLQKEFERVKTTEVREQMRSVAAAVEPVKEWASNLRSDIAPQVEAARELKSMADSVRAVILVVDDDDFQHKLLRGMLAGFDCELVSAYSGTEGLAFAAKRRADLVLMDVNLPDIDGVETTRRMKAAGAIAKTPIVMMTGNSEKQVVVESLKAGAVDFVVKPIAKMTLLPKIEKLLGRQRR